MCMNFLQGCSVDLSTLLCIHIVSQTVLQDTVLVPVVQKVNSATLSINLYPVDSAVGFPNTYPVDSAIQLLNDCGLEIQYTVGIIIIGSRTFLLII